MWPENFIITMSTQEDAESKRTDICSEATLCANDIGFFAEVADKVLETANEDDWLQNVFSTIDGDAAKIEAVMQKENVSTALKTILARVEPHFRIKDAKISQIRRYDARKAMDEGNLRKALAICSQAVIRAPLPDDNEIFEEGLTLAYAFWQRSEILLKMKKFELAMQDLKLSLSYRLPAKIRGNYYWRLGHCYKGLNDIARAKVSYELGQRLVRDEEEKKNIAADLKLLENMVAEPQHKNTERTTKQIKLTGGAKENLPDLSRLVKIAESETMGKHAVAASRIHTGDVLLIEQPYAACLLPNFYGSHCHHCFKRLEAPMPCPKCSGVAFCSNNCRDIAVSTYHGYECSYMDIFLCSGMSILSQIALRMITQAGLELSLAIHAKYLSQEMSVINNVMMSDVDGMNKANKFRRSRKERSSRDARNSLEKLLQKNSEASTSEEQKPADMFDKANLLESIEGRAGLIYSLVTHSNLRKPDDYFRRLVMSIFMTECLKKLNFFKMDNEDKLKKDELAITELLLYNLQLLQFNAHAIYETICGSHRFSGSKPIYTGVGIYPTGALFNHECYPAIARYFDGKNIILRANRPLTTGSIVSENYGPHFFNNNTTERQKDLKCRYWFKCQCIACTENWPVLKNNKVANTPILRCPNNTCRNKILAYVGKSKNIPTNCAKCGEPISEAEVIYKLDVVNDCVKQYQVGAQLMQDEKVDKAIDTLCSALETFSSVALPPFKHTHVAQEALRSCFADYGSVYQIPN